MTSRPCPICQRPSDPAFAPFCSKRCGDVDLQRWFSGVYAVPVAEVEEADEDGLGQGGRPQIDPL